MKCRNILAVAVAVAAMQSYGVSTTNEACRIAVSSATTNTIIGLAAVDFGLPATETMNATNYVLTTNLSNGDKLSQKNGSSYHTWSVQEGKWAVVASNVAYGDTAAANNPTANLPYGDAVILYRQNPSAATPFYLVGQCPLTNTTCSVGSSEKKMLANLSFESCTLGNLPWRDGAGPGAGDSIETLRNGGIGVDKYTYVDGTGWASFTYSSGNTGENGSGFSIGGSTVTTNSASAVAIPAGVGFWYSNKGSAARVLEWSR